MSQQGEHLSSDPGIGQLGEAVGLRRRIGPSFRQQPISMPGWQRAEHRLHHRRRRTIKAARNPGRPRPRRLPERGRTRPRPATSCAAQGIDNALINIGGNVMALGSKQGRKWRVGIQHPRQPGLMAHGRTRRRRKRSGTSGDHQRFFGEDCGRYHPRPTRGRAIRSPTPKRSPC
ncbi:MAG: FAD:protein FMN transferase [Dechloromonas sp.]|uniref:FAD:protein FMN transferase n=1 Tax=Candidatus Dechloromonas phosphorivorans TaxID=2899244 RepID=A0A9D7QJU0_9RHOO|nr:FAD:protein FMN transferase [Candidatus Dechloromonas phosphorivorans]